MTGAVGSYHACRACGEPLTDDASGEPCPRCRYINLFAETILRYPVDHLGMSPESIDPVEICATLRSTAELQLTRARELIGRNIPAATEFLQHSISEMEKRARKSYDLRDSSDEQDTILFNRHTQLLYLLLCELGDVHLTNSSGAPALSVLYRSLWPLLGDVVVLTRLRNAVTAELSQCSIEGGELIETKTNVDRLMTEVQVNTQRIERLFRANRRPSLALHEPELGAAQRAVLGFSIDDVKNLMRNNFRLLRKLTRVIDQDGIMIAAVDVAGERARPILEALTLTLERVRRFAVPFYFDLGVPREDIPPAGIPDDVINVNWTAYYPCYGAVAADGHTRVVLFSTIMWVNAFGYMFSARSQMMNQLVQRVRGDAGSSADEVKKLARERSARFEQSIAAQLRDHGFKAKASLTELKGAPLPCHEIDAIGARVHKGVTEIVVIEAKDLDFPLQKPGSLDRAIETLQRGGRQLEIRTEWVKDSWRELVGALGVKASGSAVLTPLLVTRRYMPPGVVPPFTVVPYNMLRPAFARLVEGNFAPSEGLAALPRISLTSESSTASGDWNRS